MSTLIICYKDEVDNGGDDSTVVPRPLVSIPHFSGPVDGIKILDQYAEQYAIERRKLMIIIVPEIELPGVHDRTSDDLAKSKAEEFSVMQAKSISTPNEVWNYAFIPVRVDNYGNRLGIVR